MSSQSTQTSLARLAQERMQLPDEAAVVARVGDEDVRHAARRPVPQSPPPRRSD